MRSSTFMLSAMPYLILEALELVNILIWQEEITNVTTLLTMIMGVKALKAVIISQIQFLLHFKPIWDRCEASFSLFDFFFFFVLFKGFITFFDTIYRFYCTIQLTFNLFFLHFQQKKIQFLQQNYSFFSICVNLMGTSNKLSRHNNQHKQKNPASVRYQDTKFLHEKRSNEKGKYSTNKNLPLQNNRLKQSSLEQMLKSTKISRTQFLDHKQMYSSH